MKGFVVALRRAKDEDMIATVLTSQSIRAYYRFYGARHSILKLGNLIDFEVEGEQSGFMPRLRGLSQMGFPWIRERNKLSLWHDFIKLFEPHLRDAEELDSFYFDILLSSAQKWHKQNPKRIICEGYLRLLKHEGRLHPTKRCYICENTLGDQISLMRAFKPAHLECIYSPALNREIFERFLESGKAMYVDDAMIEQIYSVIMKGF